jgi:hypothetical protein
VASAVNNVVARTAGLLAVAVLPFLAGITGDAYLNPTELAAGFQTAMHISAVLCVGGGVLAAVTIRNPKVAVVAAPDCPEVAGPEAVTHCALDATPLTVPLTTAHSRD